MLQIYDFIVDGAVAGQKPRFCWKLKSDKKSVWQKAYDLQIYSASERIYSTGLKQSEQSLWVEADLILHAEEKYFVKLSVRDNYGEEAKADIVFETPIEKFSGQFIAPKTFPAPNACVLFTDFRSLGKIRGAKLYITALGVYEGYINGERIGTDYLAPFWTSYDKLLEYQCYDVAELLKEENKIEIFLGKGWCRGKIGNYVQEGNHYAEESAVLAELHIIYEDGEEKTIVTDTKWQARSGFVVDSELYFGEIQDFTREESIWGVKEIQYDKSVLTPQINEPIRIYKELKPKAYLKTPNGEHVLDFGVNISGFVRMNICAKHGQKVRVEYSEILDTKGNFYTENLRACISQNTYVLSGSEQTVYPRFIYHGFRYVKVEGIEEIEPENFTAVVLMSDIKETGKIYTDNELINTLIENIKRSQRGNYLDVPTDCPQRDERLGWTGDANAFARSGAYNYNVALFFRKWLKDLNLSQEADGCIPRVVPPYIKEGGRTIAFWGDSVTMIPETMFWMYGDEKYLSNSYEAMKKYVDCLEGRKKSDGLVETICYGDWLSLDKDELFFSDMYGGTDEKYISNVFYCISLKIVYETGKRLKKKEFKEYEKRYKMHLHRVRKEYFTRTGRLTEGTQTGCVLALKFGICPKQFRSVVIEQLKTNFRKHLNRLTTGFVGTPFLLPTLVENGMTEEALTILFSKEYPGWLYAVERGATTIWERWNGILPNGELNNPSMNSFNHYAYGSVIQFLYEKIGGITPLKAGFKKILIQPLTEGFSVVKTSYESLYGEIVCEYKNGEQGTEFYVKIPCNTTAEIKLPNNAFYSLGSGEYHFSCPKK